jgi:hypothetical protein
VVCNTGVQHFGAGATAAALPEPDAAQHRVRTATML